MTQRWVIGAAVAEGDAFDPKRMLLNHDVGTFDPVAFGAFLATQDVGAAPGFAGVFLVPVERIELPTFGLQNRCSTAELNRRLEESVRRGSDLRRLEYQTWPERARTPTSALANHEKGGRSGRLSSLKP